MIDLNSPEYSFVIDRLYGFFDQNKVFSITKKELRELFGEDISSNRLDILDLIDIQELYRDLVKNREESGESSSKDGLNKPELTNIKPVKLKTYVDRNKSQTYFKIKTGKELIHVNYWTGIKHFYNIQFFFKDETTSLSKALPIGFNKYYILECDLLNLGLVSSSKENYYFMYWITQPNFDRLKKDFKN
jgi:hypothetical protein